MRKAKELLDEVPPDEIPTVIAIKIMQYETAAKGAKEVLTQALAQADKKHEEMSAQALTYEKEKIEWRRAHFQRLSVVSQRAALETFFFSMVAALQDRGIQEQLNATLSGNHWRLVTELINPKNEYLSMSKVNELLVLPEARNILWSAINFPGDVENYPVLDDQLLCGALPNIWRNLESNRVFEYSEEDAGMGEQLEK
eukprot:gene14279-10206_t